MTGGGAASSTTSGAASIGVATGRQAASSNGRTATARNKGNFRAAILRLYAAAHEHVADLLGVRGLEATLDRARPVVVKGAGVEGHAQHFRLGQRDLHGGQARVV